MARKFTIKRSGDRALSFRGKLIATAGEQAGQGEGKDRWHTITVYHTESDKLVATVEYSATWEGEEEWIVAYIAITPAGLIKQLQEHDPMACVFGYPDTPQFKGRNEHLERVLMTRYDNALASVLAMATKKLGDLGDEFVESI